jgi:recombination protein RecR
MDGVTPDQLRIQELIRRLQINEPAIEEIIIATNPTIEGDSTALYLSKLLAPHDVKLTRIASGIPMGGDLEYIDRHTLSHALQQRREL